MLSRPCGEMDITTVFGTVVGGSNPPGGTKATHLRSFWVPEQVNCLTCVEDSNAGVMFLYQQKLARRRLDKIE